MLDVRILNEMCEYLSFFSVGEGLPCEENNGSIFCEENSYDDLDSRREESSSMSEYKYMKRR